MVLALLVVVVLIVAGLGTGLLWRKSSRRTALPCPSWLGWMVELDNPFTRVNRAQVIVANLGLEAGMAVLDAGCGPGRLTLPLATAVGPQGEVLAVDASADALARGAANAALNDCTTITWREGDAFEVLRALERAGERFDVIALDPPAFAKSKAALPQALRGYHEVNLRAMRLLRPGGALLTASCSFHLRRPLFLEMVAGAAADSGRTLVLEQVLGQGVDHPELLTVPETGYLKGAVIRALD